MASTSNHIAPSSSPSSSWKPDVFLSFHGKDTRDSFTDHLRTALERNGITVFRDDTGMRGENIQRELFKAIEESLYAVVIISEKYAFSKWCLKELSKIMNRRKDVNMKVLPVFYRVDPSDVRNLKGSFEIASHQHRESEVDEEQLNSAATALKEAGYLAGWHVNNRSESTVIQEITSTIFKGLMSYLPDVPEYLAGMDSPVREVRELLEIGFADVRFVGICGISGIGKTILARIIYEKFSSQFDGWCFLPQIGKASGSEVVQRQKDLLSAVFRDTPANTWNHFDVIKVLGNRLRTRRVLIVLDDVCRDEQINSLVGDPSWFGKGSRIIVTTRDRHLLRSCHNNIYEVKKLNNDDAKKLFYYHAFIKDRALAESAESLPERELHPPEKFVPLIPHILDYADGLPAALEVFGSFLNGVQDEAIWKGYVDQLKECFHEDILDKLKINLDGLGNLAKRTFKDIACFFKEGYRDHVISKIESLRYSPQTSYSSQTSLLILERKCLISFSADSKLLMSNLIAEMGVQIARPNRLCRPKHIISVVEKKEGLDKVKGIALTGHLPSEVQSRYDVFLAMENLRMLRISLTDNNEDRGLRRLMNQGRNHVKLSNLCILEWTRYPLSSVPDWLISKLSNLVELSLRYSHVERLWGGKKHLSRLKHFDLSFSTSLKEIPNLGGVPNLEILDLSFCKSLKMLVKSSIEDLEKLRKLLLQGCCKLEELPKRFSSKSLEVLDLSKCLKLQKFPDISCSSQCLKNLDISGTSITELPSLAVGFSSLEEFQAYRTTIRRLPSNFVSSEKLQELSIVSCALNTTFQLPTFSALSFLAVLRLCHCNIGDEVKALDLSGLYSLKYLDLSHNIFTELPDNMCELFNLRELILDDCTYLRSLPRLPLSLHSLHLRDCPLGETFGGQMTTHISRDMLRTSFCFSAVAYVGFDKPHKILDLHPRSSPYADDHEHLIEPRVVCCRTRGSEILDEFPQGCVNCKGKDAEIPLDWKLGGDGPAACALSIVYEVTRESKNRTSNEPESSDMGGIFPEFVCQLQLSKTTPEQNSQLAFQSHPNEGSPLSFAIRVPEGARDGQSYQVGVFIIIPDSVRKPEDKKRNNYDSSQESEAMKRWSYSASVTACSENVELLTCGAHLLGADATTSFSQFRSSICPGTLDEQGLKRALDVLLVTGPIGGESVQGSVGFAASKAEPYDLCALIFPLLLVLRSLRFRSSGSTTDGHTG